MGVDMANSDTPVLKIPIVGILEMFVVPGPELRNVAYAPSPNGYLIQGYSQHMNNMYIGILEWVRYGSDLSI